NELKSFENNITNAYKKESEAFISNFKQKIIVEQYKVLYRELKTAKNGDENESINNKSVPEFLKKFENPTRESGGTVGVNCGSFLNLDNSASIFLKFSTVK
ncbi:hypothetical protein, partial [Mycoplasmopsis bovis]|uniref:hypothetical protein n=1 Tax=Mycoplasmopsis bovis TaxID=28903 RepID=UPI003D26F1FE